MRTVLIGLGNSILTDDGVGPLLARTLARRLEAEGGDNKEIEVQEIHAGGLRLMDALTGYDRAIIVDAMKTGRHAPGSLVSFDPEGGGGGAKTETRNVCCLHDTGLGTALATARMLGLDMPSEIELWGVEGQDFETFGERLTPEVEERLPEIAERIWERLK